MSLRFYIRIWLLFVVYLCAEYLALNFAPDWSSLRNLDLKISAKPGAQLSLILGWSGLGLMVIMHLYTARKKMGFLDGKGKLISWLNFHIFCGLLGPTFILFHSNFKARGVVAISFWSMLIASGSGIVGRYFYDQAVGLRKDSEDEIDACEEQLEAMAKSAYPPLAQGSLEKLMKNALSHVGVVGGSVSPDGSVHANLFAVLISKTIGDIRLSFGLPPSAAQLPPKSRELLKRYALAKRRIMFVQPFSELLSYWQTFHLPFSIFMYVAAVIHVCSSLIFARIL